MKKPLKKPFQLCFALLACLHLAGGPCSLLQVYAWAEMLVSYSQEGGLLQGAKDTFSGERPCELCCKISSARGETDTREHTTALSPSSFKLLHEILPATAAGLKPPRSQAAPAIAFADRALLLQAAAPAPPTPPPRA